MPPGRRGLLGAAYFFDRKFERVLEIVDQVPEEARWPILRVIHAASYAFLGRVADAERVKADVVAKHGDQVMEIWENKGEIFARKQEEDIYREAFRKLNLRICATPEELKKFTNPKRLPECVKS